MSSETLQNTYNARHAFDASRIVYTPLRKLPCVVFCSRALRHQCQVYWLRCVCNELVLSVLLEIFLCSKIT